MTVCAIVTARLRHSTGPIIIGNVPDSAVFTAAAEKAFPTSLVDARGFEYLRAKALLAILHIQYANVAQHRAHLGDYITMCTNGAFFNEARWEAGLTIPELQERRRVFWSTYTLEIYSTITWGGMVRFREQQCLVQYPAAADDDNISALGIITSASFMQGWNFTTDMYRMLEHLIAQRTRPDNSLGDLFQPHRPSARDVLLRLSQMYEDLPDIFKTVREMTGTLTLDRYGFQAANIIITMQTVKLTIAGAEDYDVERRCQIATELIQALTTIPTAYIAAVSRPMVS